MSKDFHEQPTLLAHWTDGETNIMSGFSDLGLIIEIDWKVNRAVYLLCLPALSAWSLAKQRNLRVTLSAKATFKMLQVSDISNYTSAADAYWYWTAQHRQFLLTDVSYTKSTRKGS